MSTRRAAAITSCALAAFVLSGLGASEPATDTARIDVAADRDDDDENGVPDASDAHPPQEDLRDLRFDGRSAFVVRFMGPIRVFEGGRERTSPFEVRDRGASLRLAVQGVAPGLGAISVEGDGRPAASVPVFVHGLSFETREGTLDASRHALSVTHGLPNDEAFARDDVLAEDAFRIRVEGQSDARRVMLRRTPRGDLTRRERDALPLAIAGESARLSPSVRVVASEIDLEAPQVTGRVVRAALRDRLDVELETPAGLVSQSIRVGRPPGDAEGVRIVPLAVHVIDDPSTSIVRTRRADVEELVRRQIAVANELYAPCAVGFVVARTSLERAPPPSLITIADEDGLPASGGDITLEVDGDLLPVVRTSPGERAPIIAERIATMLRAAGLAPVVHVLPRAERATDRGADVLVRHPDRTLARVEVEDTDDRLEVHVARVRLEDGLREFDNATAATGTAEERALVLGLADDDPRSLDVFVVERFTRGLRVGEAFIARDGGPLEGAIVLDFRALALTEIASTLAHELSHVLFDHALHPSDLGRGGRTSLRATGSARGDLRGARRLSTEECAELRTTSSARLLAREPF